MIERIRLIFAKLPEMDQHILMGMYNPNANLSKEGKRLKAIIDELPESERVKAVSLEMDNKNEAMPQQTETMPEDSEDMIITD